VSVRGSGAASYSADSLREISVWPKAVSSHILLPMAYEPYWSSSVAAEEGVMFENETRSQGRRSAQLQQLSQVLSQVQDRVLMIQAASGTFSASLVARQLTMGRSLPQATEAELRNASAKAWASYPASVLTVGSSVRRRIAITEQVLRDVMVGKAKFAGDQ